MSVISESAHQRQYDVTVHREAYYGCGVTVTRLLFREE